MARYDARFHFRFGNVTEDQLLATLAAVEVERNLVLEKLRDFERKRIREKMRGKRQLSNADQKTHKEIGRPIVTEPSLAEVTTTIGLAKWLQEWKQHLKPNKSKSGE